MADCLVAYTTELDALSTPAALERAQRLQDVYQTIKSSGEHGKILRFALGLRHDMGGSLDHNISAWMHLNTGVDPMSDKGRPMNNGDIALLEAKVLEAQKVIGRMEGIGKESDFRTLMKKFWYLPKEKFAKDLLQGEEIWGSTSKEDARRNERITQMAERIDGLERILSDILGIDSDKQDSEINLAESASAGKRSIREAIEQSLARGEDTHKESDLAGARTAEAAASVKLKGLREGLIGNQAGALYSDIANALMGKYGKPDLAHGVLAKKWDGKIKSTRFRDVIGQTTQFLKDYEVMAREATESARRNLELELVHMKGMDGDEAKAISERLVEFTREDNYYPRQNLINNALIQKAINGVRQTSSAGEAKYFLESHISSHTRDRTQKFPGDISRNLIPVLKNYAEDIIYMDYHNRIGVTINEYVGKLLNLRNSVKQPDFDAYVDASIREVMSYAQQMTYTPEAGIGHHAVRLLVSVKAAQTMGFWNPSTPLVNMFEGRLHAAIRMGVHRKGEIDNARQEHSHVLQKILKGEYVRMTVSGMLGERPQPTNYKSLSHIFSKEEIKQFWGIDQDTAARWTEMAADKASAGATKVLGWQRKAEEGNRKASFEMGAADEYQYIDRTFRYMFNTGEVPAHFKEKYGLGGFDLKTDEGREAAWEKFAQERVSRAGYDMMYGTQWQYNWASRHFLEKWNPGGVPVGRALMMFQHFPLNWIAAYRMGAEQMATAFQASGVKDAFAPTSRDAGQTSILGKHMNSDMLYRMSAGMLHLTNMALKYMSPVVMPMFFQSPLLEMGSNLMEYFTSDDEDRKRVFWSGGLANDLLGPHYTDFTEHVMPAIGLAVTSYLYDTGSLPDYFHELATGATGIDWSPSYLQEKQERGGFGRSWDMLREVFLWDSLAVYPKAMRIVDNIRNGDTGGLGWNLLKAGGVRPNWEVDRRKRKDDRADYRRA